MPRKHINAEERIDYSWTPEQCRFLLAQLKAMRDGDAEEKPIKPKFRKKGK